jgi:tetratricopeptide (TPR) repeat protein
MTEEMRHALPRGYEIEGYQIEKVLGAGGFGITYLAHEIAINRKVAIKEYLPSGIAARGRDDVSVHPISSGDRENFTWGLERFRQEAKTLVTFRHSNIVTVYRYFEANGTAFLVMAYEDGESLARILERAGTLSESEINEILAPLLSGLEHVHAAGFLHRDIKPGNIYIRRDGSPVLLDFGAARQALGGRSQSLTSIVSAGYAPFEQYTTRGRQGPWTDIYAFGGVLYRAVTGERPPDSPDRIRNDPYVPAIRAAAGKYSETLLRAIDAALEVDEEKRPQSVADWRALLEGQEPPARPIAPYPGREASTRMQTGAGASARKPTRAGVRAQGEPRPRRTGLAVAVIVGGLVLLGGAGAGAYLIFSSQTSAQVAEYIDKARDAIQSGSLRDAERFIADAERLKKDHPELDRLKEQLKAAREAAAAKAAQATALLARARTAMARRDYAEAERLIEEAAKLAPEHPELAAVRDALRAAREAGDKESQAKSLVARAREAIRARNFDEAQRLLDEAAALAPSLPELAAARSELAAARRSAEDSARLERLLQEARAAIARKDFATARQRLDEAARVAPGDAGLAQARRELAEAERAAGATTPDSGERRAVPGVTRSPINMCAPGSAQYVDATRTLALPGNRYCSTADWAVREVQSDGARLYWRVVFSDGHVNCQCTRPGGDSASDSATPRTATPVPGITHTPNHLCVAGTQRMVRTTRKLALPGQRYCTDSDWQVSQVTTDGVNVYWNVPFDEGVVSCACRKR